MIFSSKPVILRVMMNPPASEVSTLLLALLKEMGGMMIMLGVMLFLAARDPARNVAILDALIVGLCVLAITPLLSLKLLDIGKLYPAYFIWGEKSAGEAGAGDGFTLSETARESGTWLSRRDSSPPARIVRMP